ncbi:MAG: hypothetical protein V4720_06410 [Pseudomonadota bacterium]
MAHRNAEARLPATFLALDAADARATRAFWRGVIAGLICGGFVAAILGSLAAVLT